MDPLSLDVGGSAGSVFLSEAQWRGELRATVGTFTERDS